MRQHDRISVADECWEGGTGGVCGEECQEECYVFMRCSVPQGAATGCATQWGGVASYIMLCMMCDTTAGHPQGHQASEYLHAPGYCEARGLWTVYTAMSGLGV